MRVQGFATQKQIVSQKVADSDFNGLIGLVDPDQLQRLQEMSEPQRQKLVLHKDDNFLFYPWKIDIFARNNGIGERYFLEISLVFVTIKDFEHMMK